MGIEGEELEGVVSALDFLRRVCTAEADSKDGRERDAGLDLSGKRVLVVGGGDVAVDCARVARRLGGEEVVVHYRRSAQEMPAQPEEIEGAERESIAFELLRAPIRFFARDGGAAGARPLGCVSVDMELGEVDSSGRRRPIPIEGSERESEWDVVIMAIGLAPDPRGFRSVERRRDGTFRTGSVSGLSSAEGVFVGGDAASGPSSMTRAMGEGKRLSGEIDRYLRGEKAAEGREAEDPSPLVVDPEVVLVRQQTHRAMEAQAAGEIDPKKRLSGFSEVELPMSEDDARYGASRCLDCGVCSECGQCVSVCPAECIELAQSDRKMDLEVGSVVLSTGYRLVDGRKLSNYGHGVYPNVITGMQMDRLLAPTRPYHSLVRPSDGKVPDNVGFVFCAGSRDRSADNRLCSRVCCMYSLKQAELIMGALPLADVTMYYIDIRAFGKGHEEFFREAEAMGAEMVKAKVGQIFETENNDLELTYEDIEGGGGAVSATHDLVVLSVGLVPNTDPLSLFRGGELEADEFHYVREVDEIVSPGRTSVEGVFVAGAASAAMDIPDTIAHANGAAVQAAAYLRRKAAVR
jgi:heterodisulfide reductase subunit A